MSVVDAGLCKAKVSVGFWPATEVGSAGTTDMDTLEQYTDAKELFVPLGVEVKKKDEELAKELATFTGKEMLPSKAHLSLHYYVGKMGLKKRVLVVEVQRGADVILALNRFNTS